VVILSAGEPEYVREILTTFGWDGTGVTSGYPSISWRAVRPVLTKNVLTCKTMGQVRRVGFTLSVQALPYGVVVTSLLRFRCILWVT